MREISRIPTKKKKIKAIIRPVGRNAEKIEVQAELPYLKLAAEK